MNTLPTPASLRPRATCASSGSPLCRKRGSGRERSNERKKSFLALSRFSRSPLLYPCMHHRRQVSSVCGSENICSPCVRSLLRGGRHLHGPSLREPARLLGRFLHLTLICLYAYPNAYRCPNSLPNPYSLPTFIPGPIFNEV